MAVRMIIDGIKKLSDSLQKILLLLNDNNTENLHHLLDNKELDYLDIVNPNIIFGYLDEQFFFFDEVEKKEELLDFDSIYNEVISTLEMDKNFKLLENNIYFTNDEDIKELKYAYFLHCEKVYVGIQQTYNNEYSTPSIITQIIIKEFQKNVLFPIDIYQ